MTVKELIQKLQGFPPNLTVITDGDFDISDYKEINDASLERTYDDSIIVEDEYNEFPNYEEVVYLQ